MLFCETGVSNFALDAILTAVLCILSVFAVITAVWLIIRCLDKPKEDEGVKGLSFSTLILIILGAGFLIRFALSFAVTGYREDIKAIREAMDAVATAGFAGYYTAGGGLYPITLLVYSVFGMIANVAGITSANIMSQVLIKLPLIICDVLSALFIYKIAKKYVNGYIAVIAAGLFMLCPVFFFSSAIWGSLYSALTFGIILSLYFMVKKNYLGVVASYAGTMLISSDALYLWPLFAVFIVYNFVKAVIALKKTAKSNGKTNFTDIWLNEELSPVIRLPIYVVLAIGLQYLISLPVIISDFGPGFFSFIYQFFLRPLASASNFGYNSLGIFNLFVKNGNALGASFPIVIFAVIFAAIILGVVLLVYLSKKNRANMVLLAGYIVITLNTYFVGFTAMSLVPVLSILIMAFVLIRDRRIMQIFTVLSFAVILNACAVMTSAGYFNNSGDYTFSGNPFYTGSTLLNAGGGMAVSIICSVLAVLCHLYYTLLILDVSMSDKRKLLSGNESIGYFRSVTKLIKP